LHLEWGRRCGGSGRCITACDASHLHNDYFNLSVPHHFCA
jgi:hypothetical protein